MKVSNIFKTLFFILTISLYSFVNAAWNIDHFDVKLSPTKAKVWEAVDVTIRAVDSDNNTVVDYDGTIIIFSETDEKAEFPGELAENTYTFKAKDEWEVKFENAIKFSTTWNHKVNVYDLYDENILGIWEIEISNSSSENTKSEDITITSPDSGTTIWNNKVKVSWNTSKNHNIKIIINNELEFTTTSNESGYFEKEITDLPEGESIIKAQLLDAENNIIWESNNVNLMVNSSAPRLNNTTINPEWEVEPETIINIEVKANTWLKEVSVMLNDVIEILQETNPWVYSWSITAPKEAWEYKIDVTLKDELWHTTKESWVKSITVKKIELKAPEEKPKEENIQDKLVITGLKLTKMKSKSVLSWDKIDIAESYNVYKKDRETWEMSLIENVVDPRVDIFITGNKVEYDDFAVKAVAKDTEWNTVESANYSDITQVQTWPAEILLLLILSMIIWAFILRRKQV